MITKANVLEDTKSAIFEAITTSCCMEEDDCGCRYYLHGNEETGDLYECSGEQNPQNVLFTAIYFGELEEDFGHESMDNVDFVNVVEDLADQWMEVYAKSSKIE